MSRGLMPRPLEFILALLRRRRRVPIAHDEPIHLYSLRIREGLFSAARLAVRGIIGNSYPH